MLPGAAGLVLAAALAGAAGAAHPQDGPHTDLRIDISEQAVTFRITMNLVFVDGIVQVVREDPTSVHEVERPALAAALLEYFRRTNRLSVDGVEVSPVARSFDMEETDLSLLPLFPVSGLRGLQRLRLVLEYPVKAAPKTVSIVWGTYPLDMLLSTPEAPLKLEVAAELTTFGLEQIITFTETEPEYTWHNLGTTPEERFMPVPAVPTAPSAEARSLPVPVLSLALLATLVLGAAAAGLSGNWPRWQGPVLLATPLVLIAAAVAASVWRIDMRNPFAPSVRLPSAEEALAIFEPLHTNIYRAFDYTEPGQVYDALARSVDGELLDALYNQIYESLIMHEEGGAVSRVQAVRAVSSSVEAIGVVPPDDAVGFQVLARWQVDGSVYHWGHSHRRTSEYAARYTVKGTAAGWRIAASQVLEQKRLEPRPLPGAFEVPPGTEL